MDSMHFAQGDRDLLITIKTQLERAVLDIKDMNAKFDERESKYATRQECIEMEKRMAEMEKKLESKIEKQDIAPIAKMFWGIVGTVITTAVLGGLYIGIPK